MEEETLVKIYIYDLTKGMANMMSTAILGKLSSFEEGSSFEEVFG